MYDSQCQAARAVGVHQASIWSCCRGTKVEAGGFGWRYATGDRYAAENKEGEKEQG
jgi:hypothetical protein